MLCAQGGFVDFDAVPEDGATVSDVLTFLLSPEAEELRPLLVSELTSAVDLFARDRVRKTFVLLKANLAPKLPFFGALPALPVPPVFVPGLGFIAADTLVDTFFPKLSDGEALVLDTQLALVGSVLGVDPKEIGEVCTLCGYTC